MKKILILAYIAICLVNCKDVETADVSGVTIFPTFEMLGEKTIIIPVGSEFVDPGVTAFEGDNEIEVTVTGSGVYKGEATLNTSVADEYTVQYSAENSEGYLGSSSRKVIVSNTGDLVNSLEGVYVADIERGSLRTGLEYVYIWKNSEGVYELSDGIGGWYNIGSGYGTKYISSGAIINMPDISSGTFTSNTFSNDNWGGDCDILSVVVDPVAKTIDIETEWSFGYLFKIHLTQVN